MKVKLTPLNIVSAVFLVIAVLLLTEKKGAPHPGAVDISKILIIFSFLISVIAFISDQIFRRFIPQLKKLWIIEGTVILFTILLIFIIKVSIN